MKYIDHDLKMSIRDFMQENVLAGELQVLMLSNEHGMAAGLMVKIGPSSYALSVSSLQEADAVRAWLAREWTTINTPSKEQNHGRRKHIAKRNTRTERLPDRVG